jgi:hypothetical protein
MRFEPVQIISSGDMSQATVTSNGIDMNQIFGGSISAVFTGSPVGTLTLEISNDIVAVSPAGGSNLASAVVNWSTYTGSSYSISAAGDYTYILPDTPYRWLRLKYTKTSGTGTINAYFSGKGV